MFLDDRVASVPGQRRCLLRVGAWCAVGLLLIGSATASSRADEVETAQALLDQGWVLRWGRLGDALRVTRAARDAQRLFDAAEMAAAGSLEHVRELHISAMTPAFTEAALAPLAKLKQLEYLTLDGRVAQEETETCLGENHLKAVAALTALRRLNVGTVWFRGTAGLSALRALPLLQSLALESPNLGDEQAEAIGKFPRLEELQIATRGVLSERGLQALAQLADLRTLVLIGGIKTDRPLAGLSNSKSLRKLVLQSLEITGDGLDALAGASHFEDLALYNCLISPDGLRAIQNCPHLRKLKLARCGLSPGSSLDGLPPLRFAALESLALRWSLSLRFTSTPESFPALRALWLQGDHPTDRLSALANLEALHLQQLEPGTYDQVLGEQVKNLPALKHLSIRCANLSAAALAGVCAMPAISSLVVADSQTQRLYPVDAAGDDFVTWFQWRAGQATTRANGDAIPPVAAGIRSLSVAAPITSFVDGLKTASRLKSLKVSGNTLNDPLLGRVAMLDSLEDLTVENAYSVTDAGLRELKALTGLRSLRVGGLDQITSQSVAELADTLRLEELECYSTPLESERIVGLPVQRATAGKERPYIDHVLLIDDDDQLMANDVFYYRARPLPGNLGTIDED